MLRPPLRLLYFTVRAPPRSATAQSPRLREHPVFTRTPLNSQLGPPRGGRRHPTARMRAQMAKRATPSRKQQSHTRRHL
eukprot:scaffold5042_cov37-Phaeocystis_antarctica.AAC.2